MPRKFMLTILMLVCSVLALAGTGYVPHLLADQDQFVQLLRAENPTEKQQSLTVKTFDAEGHVLASVSVEVLPGQTFSSEIGALFEEILNRSYLVVEAEGGLILAHAFRSAAHRNRTVFVPLPQETASSWRIEALSRAEGDLGLAVINTGKQATDVWLALKAVDGRILRSQKIASALGVKARLSARVDPAMSPKGDSFLEVYANQKLAVTVREDDLKFAGKRQPQIRQVYPKRKADSVRDARGVWFITGASTYDAIEMMGYNVAEDRLWQAEIFRRTARGRLAEIFGPDLAGQDIQVRTVAYSDGELDDIFAGLDGETQSMIQGYVDGFNRRIAEVNGDPSILPFEFWVLGMLQLEDWSHRDVMAWVSLLQRNFSGIDDLGLDQVLNGALLQQLVEKFGAFRGVTMFMDLRYINDPDAPVMAPGATAFKNGPEEHNEWAAFANLKSEDLPDLRSAYIQMRANHENNVRLLKEVGGFVKGGSYAWAISGSKTQSGNPIIYSGPQMGFSAPIICIEGSLKTPDLEVSGMTIPGIPSLIIGRTPHHAWSMQVGHTHTWDFYLENEADIFVHRTETIKVAGGDDITVPVFRSAHGPIVNQQPLLAWKYAAWGREFELSKGNLALARAQNMDDFGQGVAHMGVTQHFTYVDRDGNIAYWMSGRNPVRTPGEYRLPQGLLGPPLEWDAANVRPPVHDRNNAQGFYGGWNNKATPDASDPTATFGLGPFHRAHAVNDYFRDRNDLTYEQIRDFALNIATTDSFHRGGNPWLFVGDAFGKAVTLDPNPQRTAALALLADWDGHFIAGGPANWVAGEDRADAWVLMDRWIRNVLSLTFDDELGPLLNSLARFNVLLHDLKPESALRNGYRKWFRNESDRLAPQTAQQVIVHGLDMALESLGARPWGAGLRSEIEYNHQVFGLIATTPYSNRSTYAHCLEYDASGPIRIESFFPLGQPGTVFIDQNGNPVPDANAFSLLPNYNSFELFDFPLFQ